MKSVRIVLGPPPPLDFALTARVLRRSPRNVIDRVDEDGSWTRAVVLSEGPALLSGKQHAARLVLEATPARARDERAIRALVTRVFSLEFDPEPFWRRARRERGLAELVRRCAGLRPQRFPTLFEALANGICCQQFSLASGMTRLGHLAERFGARTPDGARVGPPEPERIAGATLAALRAAGLSASRAAELREIARLQLERFERELAALPDEQARARLRELPGIGPWTADYVLLRGLGRLDVFPAGDVGAAHTLGRILGRGMLYFCMLGFVLGASRVDR